MVGRSLDEARTRGAVAKEFDHLRRRDDQFGGVRAGAQDLHEALADHALVAQHAQKPALILRRLRKLAVVQQPRVRVRGATQPVHERRQQDRLQLRPARGALHQRGEVVVGARRVAVAECGELGLDGVGAQGSLAVAQVHHRAKQRTVENAFVQVGHGEPDLLEAGAQRLGRGRAWAGAEA